MSPSAKVWTIVNSSRAGWAVKVRSVEADRNRVVAQHIGHVLDVHTERQVDEGVVVDADAGFVLGEGDVQAGPVRPVGQLLVDGKQSFVVFLHRDGSAPWCGLAPRQRLMAGSESGDAATVS